MKKTHAKFQKCKRSCAHNKYPLSIYSGWKMTKFTMPKKWQKLIQILYVQSTCTSSYHEEENTCKVSKQLVQNCKRSCAHKIPMLNVDGWTYEHMNVRKLARLCLPAKADATKNDFGWGLAGSPFCHFYRVYLLRYIYQLQTPETRQSNIPTNDQCHGT